MGIRDIVVSARAYGASFFGGEQNKIPPATHVMVFLWILHKLVAKDFLVSPPTNLLSRIQ